MLFRGTTSLPRFSSFMSWEDSKVAAFAAQEGIRTLYLPLDGTRRYFVAQEGKDHDSKDFLHQYLEFSIRKTLKLLETCYDLGLQHLIVLLMDDSAFARGKSYLKEAVDHGIVPTTEDRRFIDFYSTYRVNVYYGGFYEQYIKYGFVELLQKFQQVTERNQEHQERTLTFYTGASGIRDYLLLITKYHSYVCQDHEDIQDPTELKDRIIADLYTHKLPSVDLSIFFGHPRDKILPPLLWGEGVKFFAKNPSLSLSNEQIRRAIFLTAHSKRSIRDRYQAYQQQDREIQILQKEGISLMDEGFYLWS